MTFRLGAFPGLRALMAVYMTAFSSTFRLVCLHLLLLTDSSTESSWETAFPPRACWELQSPVVFLIHTIKTAGGK